MFKKGYVYVDGSKELASTWLIRVHGGEVDDGERGDVEGGDDESVWGGGGDLSGGGKEETTLTKTK